MSTEGNSNDRYDFKIIPTWILVVLGCLAAALFCFALYFVLHMDGAGAENTPEVVIKLLDSLTDGDEYYADILEESLPRYLSTSCQPNVGTTVFAYTEDFINFESIFFSLPHEKPHSYILTAVADGYVEILLLDSEECPMYPRIGFAYILSEDSSEITGYTLARLQPFSVYDEEYREHWS